MSQTQVERLLRIAWRTVGTILARVVADKLDRDRLDGLRSIGVDENGRLEALNSKVRLLSHRAYGFHSADGLIAMIYLCCAGIQIALPHR
jgi:hypothetical protein